MLPSALVYTGLLLALVGSVSAVWPLRRLKIRSRRRAAVVLAAGALLVTAGIMWPSTLTVIANGAMRLDAFVPSYQFNEVHVVDVHSSTDAAYAAIGNVTAREVRLFRTLTWLRSPHLGSAPASILAPPLDQPILDVATRTGFMLLAADAPREIVFGTIGAGPPPNVADPTPLGFQQFNRPGYAKIAMNFSVAARGDGWSTVRTETRVFATNADALRRFRIYWRVIYPGSAIIRVMWLRAIKERAERPQ